MILENLEVLTRKIRFAAEVRILSFFTGSTVLESIRIVLMALHKE